MKKVIFPFLLSSFKLKAFFKPGGDELITLKRAGHLFYGSKSTIPVGFSSGFRLNLLL